MPTDETRHSFDIPVAGGGRAGAEISPADLASIGATFNRYALATDTADGEMLKGTFDLQAVFVGYVGTTVPSLQLQGSAEIAAYVVETRRQHAYCERHFITNLSAQALSADSARAQAYFLVTRIDGNTVVNSATGTYEADLVRGDDGVWRFVRIDIRTDTALQ